MRVFVFAALVALAHGASWTQIGSRIRGVDVGDESGTSVALSDDGSRLVIGAPKYEHGRGLVRVYDWVNGQWKQLGQDLFNQLEPDRWSDDRAGDQNIDNSDFGFSVSISPEGNCIAVGAPNHQRYYDTYGTLRPTGIVKIFDLNPGTKRWDLRTYLWEPGKPDANWGHSVALSSNGERVAIGGTVKLKDERGAVHVYAVNSQVSSPNDITTLFSEPGYVGGDDHLFGFSVSISSDGLYVAVGGPKYEAESSYNPPDSGIDRGHVRLFYIPSANNGVQVLTDLEGDGLKDYFGFSVTLSSTGDRLAIGSRYAMGDGKRAGHARIYDRNATNWIRVGQDIEAESEHDNFGFSVSLSNDGNRLAVGAPFNDGVGTSAGHVRIFDLNGDTWQQVGGDIDGVDEDHRSGWSVALAGDGTRVAVGAPKNLENGTVPSGDLEFGGTIVYEYESSSSSSGLSTGAIVGIAIGGAALVILVVVAITKASSGQGSYIELLVG